MTTDRPTINALLDRAAGSPDAGLRFVDRAERAHRSSWSDVRRRALDACGSLQAAGVAAGDRVAIIYPTGPGFFDAFFGVLLAGAVPVPLYPPLRLGRLEEYQRRTARMIELVRARLVLADRRVKRVLGEAIRRARPPLGCRTLEDLPASDGRPAGVDAEDLALVQFSSGTTVDPKPVALSHRAVVAQAALLNGYWPDDGESHHSGVSWLPLYHDMGLVGCVFPALERRTTMTLIPPENFVARPAVWLRTISRYRATVSPAPNFAYSLCLNKIRDEQLDGVELASWRVALNGAETVVPSVLRAFRDRFARWGLPEQALTPVYGLAEAALAVTFSDPARPFEVRSFDRDALATSGRALEAKDGTEIVSVGEPLPGFEMKIVDGRGSGVEPGRVGRVHVRGPSVMQGYLDQPEATAEVLQQGWLDTGDLGFVHENQLYLTGREKDLLIIRGRNHAPEEVESVLDAVCGVRTGCAVAVSRLPEGAEGEVLLVFAEARKDVAPSEYEGLARRCSEAVLAATALAAERILIVAPGTLPRTSSGKLRRGETLQRFLAGELQPPRRATPIVLAGAVARSRLAYALMRWDNLERPAD